jgi:hypothetical protein
LKVITVLCHELEAARTTAKASDSNSTLNLFCYFEFFQHILLHFFVAGVLQQIVASPAHSSREAEEDLALGLR